MSEDRATREYKKALALSEQAFGLQHAGRESEAVPLFAQASRIVWRCAVGFHEPIRCLLLRDAAILAVQAKNYVAARKMIEAGLFGDPMHEVAEEMRELLASLDMNTRRRIR